MHYIIYFRIHKNIKYTEILITGSIEFQGEVYIAIPKSIWMELVIGEYVHGKMWMCEHGRMASVLLKKAQTHKITCWKKFSPFISQFLPISWLYTYFLHTYSILTKTSAQELKYWLLIVMNSSPKLWELVGLFSYVQIQENAPLYWHTGARHGPVRSKDWSWAAGVFSVESRENRLRIACK